MSERNRREFLEALLLGTAALAGGAGKAGALVRPSGNGAFAIRQGPGEPLLDNTTSGGGRIPAGTPVYACPRIDREIVLDGRLSDPLWKTAPVVRLTDTVTGEAGPRPAEVRLLYSATTLFIGFVCPDDYVWGTRTRPDSDIYAEECVEAFLSPSGVSHQYYEIDVSPRNTVFAACILNPRSEAAPGLKFRGLKDYHPDGLVTRVSVDGEMDRPGGARAWRAEYAIPLDALIGAPHVPPRPGDVWRMNLYRIDAPAPGRQEFQAWSPTGRIDFHRPWTFGALRFL